ncbi:hypothetical protein PHYSODRAFT_328592 [Phytophthora sojae]|uniref:Uncharacterized protein n=1 Tax=Phytophthora sojae (strain P6497) TaxID=1094619 RepID=G4Z921_PHYSP|nr:hypothetical protein PHYSODRAFT_328592 [Phytophthora sojae]EGZ20488.1 hypothetical protein PHYSODRAFT_328592 [Phytophthora sojae]|eukprot:XP_009523205.1 hypothetical protein PHYSODRAFT_328592 [Phytophthora sojae]
MNCCCSRIIATSEANICCTLSACCIAASFMFAPTLATHSLERCFRQCPPTKSQTLDLEICFRQVPTTCSSAPKEATGAIPSGASSSPPRSTKTPTTKLVTATDADVTLGCALFASDSRGDKRKIEVGAAYGHAEKEKERARRKWRPRRRRADEAADKVTHAAHPEKLNGERYRCSTPKNGCEEDGVRNGNAGRTRLDGVHTGDAWRHWNWNRNWTEARVGFASATKYHYILGTHS